MATNGEKPWPPAGRFSGRLRGGSHGHRQSAQVSSLLLVQLSHGSSGGVVRPTGGRLIGLGDLEPRAGISGANCCRIQCQLPVAGQIFSDIWLGAVLEAWR